MLVVDPWGPAGFLKKVDAGSQQLQNIVGYGFQVKQMEQGQKKIPKTKVHELSKVQK